MKLEVNNETILKVAKPLIVVFGLSFAVYLLWNWLFTSIFELPIITYWQALGLYVMSKVIFKPYNLWEKAK